MKVFFALCGLLLLGAQPAAAGLYMQLGGSGPVAVGFINLCSRDNDACPKGAPSTVEFTHKLRELLQRINFRVNASIRYVSDPPGQDQWSVGVSQGDCEEYALAKQQMLEKSGLPIGALHIALAYASPGKPHAVLVVHTTAGDFVLDNRSLAVRRWDAVPYQWISLIVSENPIEFRKIL